MSIIAIPNGSTAEECYEMITKKMQPLWTPRQNVRVDGGTALELNRGDWRMRIGDVRITSRQGQGNIRGVVVEVQYCGDEDEEDDGQDDEKEQAKWNVRDQMLRSFFEAAMRESNVAMEGLRVVIKVSGVKKTESSEWVLLRQYMELLRFARTA
jgi:TATA-binding related factor (TRF) of subunit 20 of Mediator complex